MLHDTGIWRRVGVGTLSDYSLLPPQIWRRILQKGINETKLKAVLWKGFFLVRQSAYTAFPSELLTLLLLIHSLGLYKMFLSMTTTIVLFSTATKFCTGHLGDFSSAFYLQQGCISQEKTGVLFQQGLRKLRLPSVKGLCWIPFPN